MVLKDNVYNVLKWVVLILMPALGALYFGMSEIWHTLPYPTEVVGTLSLAAVFLGTVIGVSDRNYKRDETKQYDGQLEVDSTSPEKDIFNLVLFNSPEDIAGKDQLKFKVKPLN